MLKDKMRWMHDAELVRDEAFQSMDEGKDVSLDEVDRILKIECERERDNNARRWMERAEHMPVAQRILETEPLELSEIRRLLPDNARERFEYREQVLSEHIRAAWAGRMSGCLLGAPVEGWTSNRIRGFSRDSAQPLDAGYMTSRVADDVYQRYGLCDIDPETSYDRQYKCWSNHVERFPVDDDTNYTVLSLRLIERFGRGFTPEQYVENMLYAIPVLHVCTAERIAYRNILNCIALSDCASHLNPYREWIGAQIRVDLYGYINPGDPYTAADMAYRDACVTHVRNGVYAAMYVAALVSLAPCGMSGVAMIETAMRQIPPACRLATRLNTLIAQIRSGASFQSLSDAIHSEYDEREWFWWGHAIPNALIVSACLACFENSHTDAISNAVSTGFDTDCNAATVGSMVAFKTNAVDQRWLTGIRHELQTSVHGYERLSLDTLASRTLALTNTRHA